jgi:predicted nucleic acid-binding protein
VPFVADASVVLAWLFENEASPYAESILTQLRGDMLRVPSVWPLEIANVLLAVEGSGRLTRAQLTNSIERLLNLRLAVEDVPLALAVGRIMTIARDEHLTVYDASYLELAMGEGLALATQDEELRAAANRLGVGILE